MCKEFENSTKKPKAITKEEYLRKRIEISEKLIMLLRLEIKKSYYMAKGEYIEWRSIVNTPEPQDECEHPFYAVHTTCMGEINKCLKCGKSLDNSLDSPIEITDKALNISDVTSSFSYKCNGQDLTAKVTVTYSANRYHCEQIDKCSACGKYHIWDGWK